MEMSKRKELFNWIAKGSGWPEKRINAFIDMLDDMNHTDEILAEIMGSGSEFDEELGEAIRLYHSDP